MSDGIVSITPYLEHRERKDAECCIICRVQLGREPGMCPKASGLSDTCYECAIMYDPPELPKTLDEDYGYTIDGRPA
jgi:hypothetical protein